MRAPRILAVVLVASFAAWNAGALDVPRPSAKETWLTVSAGEFRIFSNAPERQTRELATDLLRMREALGKLTKLNVQGLVPTYVLVFRDGKSFAPYRDLLFGRRDANAAGVYLASRTANFIALRADVDQGSERVIYHELTHYFVRNTATSNLPLWLNEGLAEYYSTFTAKEGKVSVGRPVHGHVNWLRHNQLIPLREHFAITQQSLDYNEGTRQGAFYAQSWALVHYLLVGNEERRGQLGRFLTLLGEGKNNEEAFRGAFHADYATLEHELRSYVRKRAMGYISYTLDELQVPEVARPAPAARDELLFVLGSMYARNQGTAAQGEALLLEAQALNADRAEVYASLAYLYDARGEEKKALAMYEKAAALGSRDAVVYILYGGSLLRRGAEIPRARQLFERATQLDPNDPRAWAGLGATYVSAGGDVKAGIAALEKSLALDAAQEDVAVNLAQLYARAGRYADAVKLMRPVAAATTDPLLKKRLEAAIREFEERTKAKR